jgi:predicted transcriptional regulator
VDDEIVLKKPRKVARLKSVEDFFKRSHERAVKLDRKVKLPTDLRITFEDPADLMRALSAQRVKVLQVVRRNPRRTVTRLATVLKRDRKSVTRDVVLLEELGLIRTRTETNPGHGVVRVVEPLAEKYHLTATL